MQILTPTPVFNSCIIQNHKYFNINLKSINSRNTLAVFPTLIFKFQLFSKILPTTTFTLRKLRN